MSDDVLVGFRARNRLMHHYKYPNYYGKPVAKTQCIVTQSSSTKAALRKSRLFLLFPYLP